MKTAAVAIKILLFVLVNCISTSAYSQNNKPYYQSNPNLKLSEVTKGVKYIYIYFDDAFVDYVVQYPNSASATVVATLIEYFKHLGFENVNWGKTKNNPVGLEPSHCNFLVASAVWRYENDWIKDLTLHITTCNQDLFTFKAKNNVYNSNYNELKKALANEFVGMYNYEKGYYDVSKRLKLPSRTTNWTKTSIKNHFTEKGVDEFEGIYEVVQTNNTIAKYELAIVREGEAYNLIYLGGAKNYEDWIIGELKGELLFTATSGIFKTSWVMANKSVSKDHYITFESGSLKLHSPDTDPTLFIKLFPSVNDDIQVKSSGTVSGTGFAISNDGYIVTNYHVVEGASIITIKGIKGDFTRSYSAKVVVFDKTNDLAILRITDTAFKGLGAVPYMVPRDKREVGSSVFALGYPLRSTMGDEIKLTNGIISSNSGFQGDITTYQISAPVQPGNSGGPLFDSDGNIIGIINAKHTGAESVSYAIKVSYLYNLFDQLEKAPKLPTISSVKGKPLPAQVTLVKKYVYIIEAGN